MLLSPCHICQRAVGPPRNTHKISNLPVIVCTQRPISVPIASAQRSHSVFIASLTLLRRASSCCSVFTARHGALTAHTQRSHGDHSVKDFLPFLYYEQPYACAYKNVSNQYPFKHSHNNSVCPISNL